MCIYLEMLITVLFFAFVLESVVCERYCQSDAASSYTCNYYDCLYCLCVFVVFELLFFFYLIYFVIFFLGGGGSRTLYTRQTLEHETLNPKPDFLVVNYPKAPM